MVAAYSHLAVQRRAFDDVQTGNRWLSNMVIVVDWVKIVLFSPHISYSLRDNLVGDWINFYAHHIEVKRRNVANINYARLSYAFTLDKMSELLIVFNYINSIVYGIVLPNSKGFCQTPG